MKHAITLLLLALPALASAQDRADPPAWQISAYGSWTAAGSPPSGSGHLDASAPLVRLPLFGPTTLSTPMQTSFVSSWFFGAGAALLGTGSALTHASAPSLDSTLTGGAAGPQSGGGAGVSVTRRLRGRFGLEVGIGASRTGTGFSPGARNAIAVARSSYETLFQNVATMFDENTGTAHVSAAGVNSRPSELSLTGALRVDFRAGRRLPLHLVAGGGAVGSHGADAAVTLVNDYAFNPVNFRSGLPNTFAESDHVVLHVHGGRLRPVVTLGAGTERRLSSRSGIEIEARAALSRPTTIVTVDATPHVALVSGDPDLLRSGITGYTGSAITFPITPDTPPATMILFDSNADWYSKYPSSLSGPALSGLQTFSGRGLQINTTLRVGLYYRF